MNMVTLILYLFSEMQIKVWSFSIIAVIISFILAKCVHISQLKTNISYFVSFIRDNKQGLYKWYSELPTQDTITPVYFGFSYFRMLIIQNPKDIQEVENNFLEKPRAFNIIKNIYGEGILTSPVEKWHKHRRILEKSFSRECLNKYVSQFGGKNKLIIDELKSVADSNIEVDMQNYIYPAFFEALMHIIIGYEKVISLGDIEEFEKSLNVMMAIDIQRWYRPWLLPDTIFNFYYFTLKGYSKYRKILKELPRKVLDHRLEESSNEEIKGDFIRKMCKIKSSSGSITEQDILDEIETFIVAGTDTQGITMGFALLMLAMHPEIQQKVRTEIDEVLGTTETEFIKIEQLISMVYLQQCIKETIRLFPVTTVLLRHSTFELKLSTGFTIPKGTDILIPVAKIHRNPEFYPNPLVWNPDNFLPENEYARHKYTFLGFGAGPRGCIGTKYSMLYMKSVIASILRNYTLTTDVKFEDIKIEMDLLIRSAHGYKMKLWRRKSYLLY